MNTFLVRAGDYSHAFSLCVKQAVLEKPADINRCIIFFDVQPHQAISRMTKMGRKEITVAGEKGRVAEPMQERNDIIILNSKVRKIATDLTVRDSPPAQ